MPNSRKPQLLDLVAVLHGCDDPNVEVGDVGTVVELLPPDGAEVEFLDRDGKTRCVATLEDAMGRVATLLFERPSVLICMEADPAYCHRTRLASRLAQLTELPISHLRAES